MKKIVYIIVLAGAAVLITVLAVARLNREEADEPAVSTVINPVAKERRSSDADESEASERTVVVASSIQLAAGDSFITELDVDANGDGFDDKVVAVRRSSENACYLILALQNPIQKEYNQVDAVRVDINQTQTLSLYPLDLGMDEVPAIVCSGTGSDNIQILTIFLPETDKKNKTTLTPVAAFHADVQIRLAKKDRAETTGLSLYTVSCFESDPANPNSLTQIEKVYEWSVSENAMQKVAEKIIPGEKVESQILQKIGGGNIGLFREFLQGLWMHIDDTGQACNKRLYFNDDQNEIIFTDGELQEIYVISSVSQRRFGLYFTTYNKSLTNIILLVDIQIRSLTEIAVHVTERVTSLKIGAESLWDGNYKKKDDSIRMESSNYEPSEIERLLKDDKTVWANDNYRFSVSGDTFTFVTPLGTRSGNFTFLHLDHKTILQLRYNNLNSFFDITKKQDALLFTEVSVKLDGIHSTDNEPILLHKIKE